MSTKQKTAIVHPTKLKKSASDVKQEGNDNVTPLRELEPNQVGQKVRTDLDPSKAILTMTFQEMKSQMRKTKIIRDAVPF